MKKISVVIPTYNEELNVMPLYEAITAMFVAALPQYAYEILFIDNKSKDHTRDKLRILCDRDKKVKAIFNAKNFGQFNSPYYGMTQATGDCVILMCADFQDPVEMIPKFVAGWEEGYKIVIGIKTTSKEHKFAYFLRSCYYRTIKKISDVEQIEHFTGFGLYDNDFIRILSKLDDPAPYLRGIVGELGYERKEIPYEQAKRRAGKTSNNWYKLYDAGMLGITSYSKVIMRIATMLGFIVSALSLFVALVYFVLKLLFWNSFPLGTAPILIGIFLMGSIQVFFIGLLGEYVLNINTRIMKRPLVVEEQRLNFEEIVE
ncbi:MAG: glycosyltransferase family 2 protein [Christensenellales bacterium]